MAAAGKKGVERETLDLIVENIKTAHAGTNALISEKFDSLGKRVTLNEKDIISVRKEQGHLAKKVYVLIGAGAAFEVFITWFQHKP